MEEINHVALTPLDSSSCLPSASSWCRSPLTPAAEARARIGFLSRPNAWDAAFQQGLHDLGWVDGQNIAFEYRWAAASGPPPALAEELVALAR